MSYACLYVALSRVRKREHVRLLLNECNNKTQQWCTLEYISHLAPDKSIKAFFAGFSNTSDDDWLNNDWNKQLALDYFEVTNNW